MSKLIIRKTVDLSSIDRERSLKFRNLDATGRFLFTCNLIELSRRMGGKQKLPAGKGLIIRKKTL